MNPFKPGFGQYPTVAAERTEILHRWSSAFSSPELFDRGHDSLLIADRGVGKTVLLDALHDIAVSNGWLVADVASIAPIPAEQRIITQLWDPPAPTARTTQFSIKLGPLGFQRSWEPAAHTRPESLRAAVEAILDSDPAPYGVLVLFDELHDVPSDELKVVGNQIQLLRRSGRRVGFAGAGLPTMDLSDPASTPTFLTRAWPAPINTLDDAVIARTFLQTLAVADLAAAGGVAETVAAHAGGLPYAMQVLGWELVEHGRRPIVVDDVAAVLPSVHHNLITSLRLEYRPSATQRAFAAAVAALGTPARIADVAQILGRTQKQLSPIRARLIAADILAPTGHGLLDFTRLGYRAIAASDPGVVDVVARARTIAHGAHLRHPTNDPTLRHER